MSIEQMRAEVKELYPWPSWSAKVDEMPRGQILAIYTGRVLRATTRKGGGAK